MYEDLDQLAQMKFSKEMFCREKRLMMMPFLFTRVSIFDVVHHQQEKLKAEVNNELDGRVLEETPEEELVQRLAAKYKLDVPVLDEEKALMSHRETNVDVSGDPMRMILDRNRPFYIKGTEVTISVPFRGDPGMFQVRPTTFTLNPPRGEAHGSEIHLKYVSTDNDPSTIKNSYQSDLQAIRQSLNWLQDSVAGLNSNLGHQAKQLITARKRTLASAAQMVSEIGIPIKHLGPKPAVQSRLAAQAIRKSINSPKKWDVFISHASEDKEQLVRPLAQALSDRGIGVWYDEFSLKMGDSLRSSIDYGLANSRYGVVVLSKSFFAKHWPVQELNGLFSKELKGKNVILPIWHTVKAEEVRAFSPMLADRKAISSDAGIDNLVRDIINALEED